MAKWFVAAKKADFYGIGQRFHISPVLARIIRNRDIEGEEQIEKYLHGSIDRMYDPALLKGSGMAALLLEQKIKEKKACPRDRGLRCGRDLFGIYFEKRASDVRRGRGHGDPAPH